MASTFRRASMALGGGGGVGDVDLDDGEGLALGDAL
jgi:hypothetical protein